MTWSTRIRKRSVLMVTILALVLVLALSACGGRGVPNASGASGGYNSGQATGSQIGGNPAAQDLQNADQQVRDAVSAMDSTQTDAGADLSAQDIEVQP
jgi:hypothetical protein